MKRTNIKIIISLIPGSLLLFFLMAELLFLLLSQLVGSYWPILVPVLYLIMGFLLFNYCLYLTVYLWRNLSLSIISFLTFTVATSYFSAFFYSFYLLLFKPSTPIYIENLSNIAYYRYLFFSVIGLIFIFYYIFFRKYIKGLRPILQEEIRTILYTWNDPFYSRICSKIINGLYKSLSFRYLFFSTHFIICYIPRIIALIFLFNFTYCKGDLQLCLYMSPFLFLSWIIGFYYYYFTTFLAGDLNYLRSLVWSDLAGDSERTTILSMPVIKMGETNNTGVVFTLTDVGYQEHFTESDLPLLADLWFSSAFVNTLIKLYAKILSFFSVVLLIGSFVNWVTITCIFIDNNKFWPW